MTKAYTKTTWVNEVLSGDPRYDILEDGGGAFKADMQVNLATAVTQAGTPVDAATMNNIENAVDAIDSLLRAAATEKTVSGGVLTVDQSRHTVEPETGAADDIDTINGIEADTLCVLIPGTPGTNTLTLKHGTGNISCFGETDIAWSTGMVVAYRHGTTVFVAGGGGGGSVDELQVALISQVFS